MGVPAEDSLSLSVASPESAAAICARSQASSCTDLAAVFFDEFAGFFAFHARECAGDDGGLALE